MSRWPKSVDERILEDIDRSGGPDACWLWRGALNDGYAWRNGRYIHRWAFVRWRGPIPAGKVLNHVCHDRDEGCLGGPLCLHRRCCNPAHVEPATRSRNSTWSQSYGPLGRIKRCPRGHALLLPGRCRRCKLENGRAARARGYVEPSRRT